jgi:hypothetical protein
MLRSVIKLKSENLFVYSGIEKNYILFPTPDLFEDDEVGYVFQSLEDFVTQGTKQGYIEVIRTTISTTKKREFVKIEELEIRQVTIKIEEL